MSVSGSSWKGNAPSSVTINGTTYTVITKDSQTLGVWMTESGKQNSNHAETKLGGYIDEKFGKVSATVNIAVQNTSDRYPGMCAGCVETMPNLVIKNPNLKVNVYQGSTHTGP